MACNPLVKPVRINVEGVFHRGNPERLRVQGSKTTGDPSGGEALCLISIPVFNGLRDRDILVETSLACAASCRSVTRDRAGGVGRRWEVRLSGNCWRRRLLPSGESGWNCRGGDAEGLLRGLGAACCRCDARSLLRQGGWLGSQGGGGVPSPPAGGQTQKRQQTAAVHGISRGEIQHSGGL